MRRRLSIFAERRTHIAQRNNLKTGLAFIVWRPQSRQHTSLPQRLIHDPLVFINDTMAIRASFAAGAWSAGVDT